VRDAGAARLDSPGEHQEAKRLPEVRVGSARPSRERHGSAAIQRIDHPSQGLGSGQRDRAPVGRDDRRSPDRSPDNRERPVRDIQARRAGPAPGRRERHMLERIPGDLLHSTAQEHDCEVPGDALEHAQCAGRRRRQSTDGRGQRVDDVVRAEVARRLVRHEPGRRLGQ